MFIDELHTIVGAGAAEGAVDASNMLKPALARGELRVVGATTLDEYRKHVEKDPALERRFQPVLVGEPSVADTIAILRGLKEKYEIHHGVRITDNALVAAATLSDRYIGDRFLPDKAIDLVDEAASRLRIEIDSLPQEIDEVERRIVQLEIERQALLKEKDKAGVERRKSIEQEIAELREKSAGMKAQWQSEKQAIQELQATKQEVEGLRNEVDQATRQGNLQRAAELRYGRIPELEAQLLAAGGAAARGAEERPVPQGRGGRGGHRRDRGQVDRHSRHQDAGVRPAAAVAPRGRTEPARGGAARGAGGGGQRGAAEPGGAAGHQPPDGVVHLPRARPAWARPRRRARSRSSCSTTSARWCGSTCRNTWRSTRWRG